MRGSAPALAALTLFACRNTGPEHLALRQGLAVSGNVQTGSAWSFAFELRRDQYAALRVTQESADVVLTLHSPDARRWAPLAMNGFESAFLPWEERERLITRARAEIAALNGKSK